MSETITFNIKYEKDKIKSVELDQQSKDKLSQEKTQRFEDLGTSLINGIFTGVEEGSRRIFEYAQASKIAQKVNAFKLGGITISIDAAMYLADERDKYGDNGNRDHIVAWSKAIVGQVFSSVGAAGGVITGTFVAPGLGTIAGGVSGAITASIIYDVKNIAGKPISAWIGDAARIVHKKLSDPSSSQDSIEQMEIKQILGGFINQPWPSVNPTTSSDMPSYWTKNKQESIDKTTKSNKELLSKFTSPTGGPSGPDNNGDGDNNLFPTKHLTSSPVPGPSFNPSNEPLFKPTPVVQKTHNGFTNQPWNEAPSPIPTLNGFSNTPWSIFPSSKPNFDSNIPSSQPFLNIPSLSPSLFSSNPKPASNPFSNFPWNKPTNSGSNRGYSYAN